VAHRFLERLSQAADEVRARLLDVYLQFGLNATSYQLLSAVAGQGDAGCSQTEIAASLGVAESSVCTLVDRLQAEGLLHRFRSKQDRRRSLLLLTTAGRERLAEATSVAESALVRWLATSSDEDLERLSRWLDILSSNARLRDESAASPSSNGVDLNRSHARFREAG
jgi:DNA-binding MarR family transcriptional regulator